MATPQTPRTAPRRWLYLATAVVVVAAGVGGASAARNFAQARRLVQHQQVRALTREVRPGDPARLLAFHGLVPRARFASEGGDFLLLLLAPTRRATRQH